MSLTPLTSTPTKQSPASDSPGTWRHPRLNEITRRQNASTFTDKNVRRIAYNLLALLALWALRSVALLYIDPRILPLTFRSYLGWAWFLLHLAPFAQIALACLPLVRRQDDLNDIPLTDVQRKLLGLPPSPSPATADAKFSTPPRYSRSPSFAGSVGSRPSFTSSPLSGRGSPALQGLAAAASPSPYSPTGSPLSHLGLGGLSSSRRSSVGSIGPFGASSSVSLLADQSSPSPLSGKRTSVSLNSKWLYEKERRSSGSTWLY